MRDACAALKKVHFLQVLPEPFIFPGSQIDIFSFWQQRSSVIQEERY